MTRLVACFLSLVLWLPVAARGADESPVQKFQRELAKDKHPGVRAEAAWQLGQLGSTESVLLLAQALSDESAAVRARAAAALLHLGTASRAAGPALEQALEDSSAHVVGNAAAALLKLGMPKAELIPAYRRLLAKPDCESRLIAVKALVGDVPPTELFDHAWRCEEFGDTYLGNSDASDMLRKIIDRHDRLLVPQMLDALKRLGDRSGRDLAYALSRIDPPVKEAVPILAALIGSPNQNSQRGAIDALGRMGAVSLPAVPDLLRCLQSQAVIETRVDVAEALGGIGPTAAADAVPALAEVVEKDKWPKVRSAAIAALGEMGPGAAPAIPLLTAALEDPDVGISSAARNALFKLEPDKKQEVTGLFEKSRPVQNSTLFDDPAQLRATLVPRFPELFDLSIYEGSATATAPSADIPSGRVKYRYAAGTVSGPEEDTADNCKKKMTLAKIDFSLVPALVKQAPGLLGAPAARVVVLMLGPLPFCGGTGWDAIVENAGQVFFKADGKLDKVLKN